ncbi:MAG: nitroreductase family protein, partial [Bacteroidales bacterium]|nr:nitroreductase family protein [Bacteroidales bacterium]
MNPQETLSLLLNHRSIRKYQDREIPQEVLDNVLEAGARASNTGNMQVYSVVVTRSAEMKEKLSPLHFNQPMIKQAPVVLTVAADVARFHHWCALNGAEKSYDNFLWFVCGCVDSMLFAQNLSVAAESYGLGLCFLGTTLYMAKEIAQVLEMPQGVVPITTITLGYPDERPERTDRLPLEAVVHYEKYRKETDEDIRHLFAEKARSELPRRLLQEHNLPNLAQIFTQKRYPKKDNVAISQKL